MKYSLLFLSLLFFTSGAFSSRVLIIIHMPVKSHYILGSALVSALAERGHEVTFANAFAGKETKNSKITEINLAEVHKINEEYASKLVKSHNSSMWENFKGMTGFTDKLTEAVLMNKDMQTLVETKSKFDLVILETCMNEALYGYGHVFGAPIISISPTSSYVTKHLTGNVSPYATVPNFLQSLPKRMGLLDRLKNTVASAVYDMTREYLFFRNQREIYGRYFPNAPELDDMVKYNTSLVFFNSHPLFETPRPYLPNMIPIGGIHIKEAKKLPEDLQTYLDSSDGFILFSLGSFVKTRELDQNKLEHILNTFRKLPVKVIWKFDDETIKNVPKNVMIKNWLPQSDILAHPKIKLFITHGGLLSSMEACHRGVPVIGIPFFGDQDQNVGNSVNAGSGLSIKFDDINEESFTNIINEMLQNPKYREAARRRSQIFRDQETKPIDRAVYWIEFVMRNKGAEHLHSALVELNLIEYLLLDVISIILATVLTFILLLSFLFKLTKKLICAVKYSKNKKNV